MTWGEFFIIFGICAVTMLVCRVVPLFVLKGRDEFRVLFANPLGWAKTGPLASRAGRGALLRDRAAVADRLLAGAAAALRLDQGRSFGSAGLPLHHAREDVVHPDDPLADCE